jgi:hypothetical protein
MMLGQEKKRHRQGCGPFVYGDLAAESLDKDGKKIKGRLAPYSGSGGKHPRAADVCDTFGVTDGCRIEICKRGLGCCDSERGNVLRLRNLKLLQDQITILDEQGKTLGIARSIYNQSQNNLKKTRTRNIHNREETRDIHFHPSILFKVRVRGTAVPCRSPAPTNTTVSGFRAKVQ